MSGRMTEGSIRGHILRYALPLVLSNYFQLTYNAVDSIILGRTLGAEALAASGSAGPLMNFLILAISGLCIGASVILSENYGAGDMQGVRRAFRALLRLGLILALSVTVLTELLLPVILSWLRVSGSVQALSVTYLRFLLLGIPVTFLYNACASLLKSMGNAKLPLFALMISSCGNIVLDLVMIRLLGMGIAGAAVATVCAQCLSLALVGGWIMKRPDLRWNVREKGPGRDISLKILRDGGITALQQACQPVGKLMIQSQVNGLGVVGMAAFSAVGRMDDYACIPEQNLGSAAMVFLAQNRGGGQKQRLREGFMTALRLEALYGVMISLALFFLREGVMRLFVTDAEVIRAGSDYMALMAWFYLLPAMTNLCQGFFRGMHRMRVTLWGTICQITVRVIMTYILVPVCGLKGIAWASALGWILMLAWEVPMVIRSLRRLGGKADSR